MYALEIFLIAEVVTRHNRYVDELTQIQMKR